MKTPDVIHQKSVLVLLWLVPTFLLSADPPTMFPCSIEFPNHVLRFSLPEGTVRSLPPKTVREISVEGVRFNAFDPFLQRDGFKSVFEWMYDLRSTFGFEAYGSVTFSVSIQRADHRFPGKIGDGKSLEKYIRWWIHPDKGFEIRTASLNGIQATRRRWNTFDKERSSSRKIEEREIFSIPLNDELFLDVCFAVIEWVPGKTKSWKDRAIKLREQIKETIVFDKAATNSEDDAKHADASDK